MVSALLRLTGSVLLTAQSHKHREIRKYLLEEKTAILEILRSMPKDVHGELFIRRRSVKSLITCQNKDSLLFGS
ncbi:Nck-associated protein 5 [Manis javanica]|nr:Nck-associated protein 5 [Manis javanica]